MTIKKKPTQKSCLIKTKVAPFYYVHYDGKEYIVGDKKIGSCVFTEENAKELIPKLLHGAELWETEELVNPIILPKNGPSA